MIVSLMLVKRLTVYVYACVLLQLTRERIRQLEAKVLKKLRSPSRIGQFAPSKY